MKRKPSQQQAAIRKCKEPKVERDKESNSPGTSDVRHLIGAGERTTGKLKKDHQFYVVIIAIVLVASVTAYWMYLQSKKDGSPSTPGIAVNVNTSNGSTAGGGNSTLTTQQVQKEEPKARSGSTNLPAVEKVSSPETIKEGKRDKAAKVSNSQFENSGILVANCPEPIAQENISATSQDVVEPSIRSKSIVSDYTDQRLKSVQVENPFRNIFIDADSLSEAHVVFASELVALVKRQDKCCGKRLHELCKYCVELCRRSNHTNQPLPNLRMGVDGMGAPEWNRDGMDSNDRLLADLLTTVDLVLNKKADAKVFVTSLLNAVYAEEVRTQTSFPKKNQLIDLLRNWMMENSISDEKLNNRINLLQSSFPSAWNLEYPRNSIRRAIEWSNLENSIPAIPEVQAPKIALQSGILMSVWSLEVPLATECNHSGTVSLSHNFASCIRSGCLGGTVSMQIGQQGDSDHMDHSLDRLASMVGNVSIDPEKREFTLGDEPEQDSVLGDVPQGLQYTKSSRTTLNLGKNEELFFPLGHRLISRSKLFRSSLGADDQCEQPIVSGFLANLPNYAGTNAAVHAINHSHAALGCVIVERSQIDAGRSAYRHGVTTGFVFRSLDTSKSGYCAQLQDVTNLNPTEKERDVVGYYPTYDGSGILTLGTVCQYSVVDCGSDSYLGCGEELTSRGLNIPSALFHGKPHVIALGINTNVGGVQLRYAHKDAVKFASTICKLGGTSDVLPEDSQSKDRILSWLAQAATKSGKQTMIILYLSGHGGQNSDGNPIFAINDSTSIALEELIVTINKPNMILIGDMCDNAMNSNMISRQKDSILGVKLYLANPGGLAFESDDLQGSFYTNQLVKSIIEPKSMHQPLCYERGRDIIRSIYRSDEPLALRTVFGESSCLFKVSLGMRF